MRRTPVLAVDHVRLQLAETEAGALRECLQGCLAYAGCVEICTVHVHIVHRTTIEVLSAVERVLHPTHGCVCLDRAQPLEQMHSLACSCSARVSHKDFILSGEGYGSLDSPPIRCMDS